VEFPDMPENPQRESVDLFDRLRNSSGKDNAAAIRKELQESMMNNVGIFRNGPDMEKQVGIVQELKARYANVGVSDPSRRYNSELIEAMELGFMLDCAEAMTASALNRTESRGAHDREDYPERDDTNWLKHTMAYRDLNNPGNVIIGYKDVSLKGFTRSFEPKPRVY
jgi:succinate dehydrogenase / fumarate reductase flavoprotein subunit